MFPLIDPFGKALQLDSPPQRIVSLVPSQTELLSDLGLESEVAGITKFCIHPDDWFRSKPRVGGTKTVNLDTVRALQPDLVLANNEENVKEQVEDLAREFPTWSSDIGTLEEALDAIRAIGTLVHRPDEARRLVAAILDGFEELEPVFEDQPKVAYLIWKDPYMTVGKDTFIHDMLGRLGVENVFAQKRRYPEVTVGDMEGCDYVLLSSEPYPFAQKHIDELRAALPATQVILVDGELFSWYGSRLLQTPRYFEALRNKLGIE